MPPEAPARKSAITPDSFASSARPWDWEILGGASIRPVETYFYGEIDGLRRKRTAAKIIGE